MIYLTLYNNLWIKVDSNDINSLHLINDYFSYFIEGAQYSKKYKSGVWDGKVYLFSSKYRTLPYGLLFELIKLLKHNNYEVKASDEVKQIYSNNNCDSIIIPKSTLYDYRPYQQEAITRAITYKKCILRMCTSSGKTLTIYGIVNSINCQQPDTKHLIIVPRVDLVNQFKQDFIDYGINNKIIGTVDSKNKEWNKKIVISTWQTLKNNKNHLKEFDSIIVDECHGTQAKELSNILQSSNAEWRIGCTGTLPEDDVSVANIKSFLGPVVIDIPSYYLMKQKYIASCRVEIVKIHYNHNFNGEFNETKDRIFQDTYRLQVLDSIIRKLDKTCLFLVGKIETEGEFLKQHLIDSGIYDTNKIVFISGQMKSNERQKWKEKFKDPNEKFAIIATYGVFQLGINIPNLSYLVFAAPFKSKIRILQSIGRCTRKHCSKDGAVIYDIVDMNNRWFPAAGNKRLNFYKQENFNVNVSKYEEVDST